MPEVKKTKFTTSLKGKKPFRKKKTLKSAKALAGSEAARKRKMPKYKSFRLQKRIKHPAGPLPSSRILVRKTLNLLKITWRPVLILSIVFTLFQIFLVRGFQSPLNVKDFKSSVSEIFEGQISNWEIAPAAIGALFSSQGSANSETSGLYNSILILMFSLMFIWIFRQKLAGNKFTTLQAVYRSPYSLTVVLGVLIVIGLQMIPFAIGSTLFSIVMQNGIAVGGLEKAIWWLFLGSTGLLSAYMISSSIFGLYAASLPEMTPMKALRSARNLVRYRRIVVLSKFVVFAMFVALIFAGIMLPLIFFLPVAAGWTFLALTILLLPTLHAFIYTLYRELL